MCLYVQVTQQFPNAFEFNEYFLTTILDHLYSCLFGTFLFNCDKERRENKLSTRTQSLWTFINSKRAVFLNPMYCGPLDNSKALFPVASIRSVKMKELNIQIRMMQYLLTSGLIEIILSYIAGI